MGLRKNQSEEFGGAVLELVVRFPISVERDDVERIVDEARAHGAVEKALFKRLKPSEEDLA